MKKIKVWTVALAALLTTQTSFGQTDNYPELYRALPTMKNFEAYWALFQYLQRTTSKDFANANAYYQVGLNMQKSMKESDPFLETQNIQLFIKQAHLYFSLAKISLDDRDLRRHANFYPDIQPAGQRFDD